MTQAFYFPCLLLFEVISTAAGLYRSLYVHLSIYIFFITWEDEF